MEETIVTSEKTSTSFPASSATRLICRVCQKQFSNYTCPRCNSRYCSLECYKVSSELNSHSLCCTESFMRENVVEQLGQMQPNDEAKQKMIDILKRVHSEEENESVDEDDVDDVSRLGAYLVLPKCVEIESPGFPSNALRGPVKLRSFVELTMDIASASPRRYFFESRI
ncbi:hypothetical protein IFM89_014143 [Coptis chinensis]|uniref:HIT-type domain-containing protein n=1 Tax=Coptis chinensis TaxID=261450 RepID=A0A835LUA0_9MAGN|nr:hypothetical protein IFM89_014143 [Coptis chinensis]